MIGIQSQPQLSPRSNVNFKGLSDYVRSGNVDVDDADYDEFDKEALEDERESARTKAENDQEQWNKLADELENSDSKVGKKLGKGARFIGTIVGLAGTFLVAKCSSKLTIETIKNFAKSNSMKSTLESLETVKKPITDGVKALKGQITQIAENPAIKKQIDVLKASKAGKAVAEFLSNEKVKLVTEPLKKTVASLKNVKLDGNKIQGLVENTMAATATGSVLVDNLTGRNNNKSALELATGASGEM